MSNASEKKEADGRSRYYFYVPESCVMRGKEQNLATARKPGPL